MRLPQFKTVRRGVLLAVVLVLVLGAVADGGSMTHARREILIIATIPIFVIVGYWVGRSHGMKWETKQQTKRDLELHGRLVELDQSFLAGVAVRPSGMTSGKYSLEIRKAGMAAEVFPVELEVSNGRVSNMKGLPIQDVRQTGNVVSWERVDMDEGPSARFVGLMDGDGMWGRVYVEPGQGWREGEPPAHGVWRLYPQSEK